MLTAWHTVNVGILKHRGFSVRKLARTFIPALSIILALATIGVVFIASSGTAFAKATASPHSIAITTPMKAIGSGDYPYPFNIGIEAANRQSFLKLLTKHSTKLGVITRVFEARGHASGPNYKLDYCLKPQVTAYVTGPNSVYIYADIFSNCPANTTGSFNVGVKITNCSGIGTNPDSTNITFQVGTDGIPFTEELEANAGCVVCENGVPVEHPPFYLQINEGNISGVFTYEGILYKAYASPASASTTEYLSNNPPEYSPPCP